jgi:hypothetical protein
MGKFMPTFIHDGAASTKSKRHNPWKIKTKKNKKNSSLKKKVCKCSRIFGTIDMKFYAGASHMQWS